jgi:hypothetical protein
MQITTPKLTDPHLGSSRYLTVEKFIPAASQSAHLLLPGTFKMDIISLEFSRPLTDCRDQWVIDLDTYIFIDRRSY